MVDVVVIVFELSDRVLDGRLGLAGGGGPKRATGIVNGRSDFIYPWCNIDA
jgi:hypothetical protein